ncbi:MAG: signal peptidase I [Planctomycetes bacterium]|nr:signal peptidase I [Planctomycetota bacterium]
MGTPPNHRSPQRWRENLEAFTVAIVMAVMLKYFAVEAYQIPTGSMQPTLMGSEFRERGALVGEVKDRILVDKLSFHLRDPERFEVVIFKYPLNRAQNFVKRLVGMPGEQFRIQYGDLWQRADSTQPWKVLRRPEGVMDEHWKAIDVGEPSRGVHWMADGNRSISAREFDAAGATQLTFAAHGGGSILDSYQHGYPAGMQDAMRRYPEFRRSNANTVGDLRVTGEITPSASLALFTIELGEGARRYRFELPGPAAQASGSVRVEWARNESYPPSRAELTLALEAGRTYHFAAQNLDDLLALELDGERIATLEVPPAADQSSSVKLALTGGGARMADLQVWRDIFYTEGSFASEWTIPAGHYFMLGDNTQDSSDGREWRAIALAWSGGPEGGPVLGNAREGLADGRYRPDSNPIRELTSAGSTTFFRDVYGELHVFPRSAEQPLAADAQYAAVPFVPRELITGRALAVFWPLSFAFDTYRVKWIR